MKSNKNNIPLQQCTVKVSDQLSIAIKVREMPLDELLLYLKQALIGVGYIFDGELVIDKSEFDAL